MRKAALLTAAAFFGATYRCPFLGCDAALAACRAEAEPLGFWRPLELPWTIVSFRFVFKRELLKERTRRNGGEVIGLGAREIPVLRVCFACSVSMRTTTTTTHTHIHSLSLARKRTGCWLQRGVSRASSPLHGYAPHHEQNSTKQDC